MLGDFAIVLGGAAAILAIAELVIRLTVRLARHYGLSGSFVGLSILSIGTSLLEIMIHVVGSVHILRDPAATATLSAMLLGNNVGSDIFQQNVALAIVALIGTVGVVRRQLPMEVGGLIAASALLWLAAFGGVITRVEGVLLVLAYATWLTGLARTEANSTRALHHTLPRGRAPAFGALIALCFVAMALIADPLLGAATRLVARLPMSASLFGVLVLGICAALPELMTALVSIRKGQREISAGILIGSNITNPLLAAGLGATISGYTVPAVLVAYDLPVKIVTGALLYALLWHRSTLNRHEALLLIGLYVGYVLVRGALFPGDF